MKPEELAAYIGAAAWLPVIIGWVYKSFQKPKLRVVPDQHAEVGFTSFGPIFNLRLALFVENRALVIDELMLELKHQDGDAHQFLWAGLVEQFSEITEPGSGKKQIVGRDQTPIAIKVFTQAYFERHFRFQEPKFRAMDRDTNKPLLAMFKHAQSTRPTTYVQEALASQELHSFIDSRQKYFHWKAGRYAVTIKPTSPQKFTFKKANTFSFELTPSDVDQLRMNLQTIGLDLRNTIMSNDSTLVQTPFEWKWANVQIERAK